MVAKLNPKLPASVARRPCLVSTGRVELPRETTAPEVSPNPTFLGHDQHLERLYLTMQSCCKTLWFAAALTIAAAMDANAQVTFEAEELPTRVDVGYAVRLLDMNGDDRLDIAIVDSERILWLENPSWNEHVILQGTTKADNVCFAPADIDRDGDLDFALGADWTLNTAAGGTIQWISQGAEGERWQMFPIGEEPTVHRMQFIDLDGNGREELIVLPLLGRNTTRPEFQEQGVRILRFPIPDQPRENRWEPEVLSDSLHVTHNMTPTDLDADGLLDLLVVSFEGVTWLRQSKNNSWQEIRIGTGNQETSPNRGASEIKRGQLADDRDYIATIEPWHGHQVVVYTRPKSPLSGDEWLWDRHVLDENLRWGHAVSCANLDDDPDEELIIGVRDEEGAGKPRGVRIYDPQPDGPAAWKRTLLDPGGVAVEDLAAGDLDGDGQVDIVAVGRQTHNVKIYWNRPSATGTSP